MRFIKKKTYYPFPVYEFNLPAGWSCPFAQACLVKADRKTGKMDVIGKEFRCYASASERFPAVRESRWHNFEEMLAGYPIYVPNDATHIRVHASGDFYSQEYFDRWMDVARDYPNIKFWAFTKSIQFWVNRLGTIPENFNLTASWGSVQDELIIKHNLKSAKVYDHPYDVPVWVKIDTDDTLAMSGNESFALLNNFKNKKK